MRLRIVLVLVLIATFLLPRGTSPALAKRINQVTGGVGLEPPDWGDYFRVWIRFYVHQLDPSTYDADGAIRARVYNPTLGWKRLWYNVECVSFGELDGKRTATIVAIIERREGWDDVPTAGNPGEYLKWQLIDGGTPGGSGDVWRLQYYDYANFVEYWPTYPEGGCSDFSADEINYVDYGNLVIH
jgi:hypothetical protein